MLASIATVSLNSTFSLVYSWRSNSRNRAPITQETMAATRFTATVLDGHKGLAVEVPFDPAEHWQAAAAPLWSGRRGHRVRGKLNGVAFASAVVARARKHWLLIDARLQAQAQVMPGDDVRVSLQPDGNAGARPRATKPHAAKRGGKRETAQRSEVGRRVNPHPSLPGASKALARVRKICLALPESSEKEAWGAPTFRVRDKLFAMFVNNHHGDGRIALWCSAAPGSQPALVASDTESFFVPPYVGCKGWLGIRLDRRLDWSIIAELLKEAWRAKAPAMLLD